MKRWLILIGVVVVLVLLIGGIKAMQVKKTIAGYAAAPEPQAAVSTIKAAYQDWRTELAAVGTLRAVRGVDISSEVAGIVSAVDFRSGQDVHAGQPLLRLLADTDLARLDALRATAELATTTFQRDERQLEAEAIAKAQLDSSRANLSSARAQIAEQQALVAKKTIRAPFAGTLGITTVNRGEYLTPGEKIVTLQQLDPIHVDFTLPQQALAQIRIGQKVSAISDSFPDLGVDGEIDAIDPVVEADTRSVRVLATLHNPARKLLPGMFVNVRVAIGAPQRYLTLPQSAVTFNPYGQTVFVVVARGEENAPDPNQPADLAQKKALDTIDAKQRAEAAGPKPAAPPAKPAEGAPARVARQVFIVTGPTRGDQIAVLSGLAEGDEVVSSGQLKLKNGTRLNVNNSVLPSFDAAPRPQDH